MFSYQRLDTGEDRRDVVGWAPAVLKDVQADTTISIDVGVEHLGEELHNRGLVGIFLTELHGQLEGSVLRNLWYNKSYP